MSDMLAAFSTDSRLSAIFQEKMNTEEQRLFVQSFKLYLDHGRDDKAFVVNFEDIWQWMGFSRKDVGKRLLVKSLVQNVDYITNILLFPKDEQNLETNSSKKALRSKVETFSPTDQDTSVPQNGGQNKETIFLTVSAFKKFCIRANTSKAEMVRDYYLKMESILQDYTLELMKESLQRAQESETRIRTLESAALESESKMKEIQTQASMERHKALLAGYSRNRLVYILRMITLEDGKFVIKVGSTEDLRGRVNHINSAFGIKVMVLDVFPCENHTGFEYFLHHSAILVNNKYTEAINESRSIETYLMPNQYTLDKLRRYMQTNVKYYMKLTDQNPCEMMAIQQRDKLIEMFQGNPEGLIKCMDLMYRPACQPQPTTNTTTTQSVETQTDPEEIRDRDPELVPAPALATDPALIPAPTTHFQGPILQLYDPTDLTRVARVIDGLMQATRDIPGTTLRNIKEAVAHKTVYHGYRWNLIPRNTPDPTQALQIGPTVETQRRKTGYIAQVTPDKARVVRVYALQKDAAKEVNQHVSLISNAVKYGTLTRDHYWIPWDDLASEMQETYLSQHALPSLPSKARGTEIHKIDPASGEIVHTYPSFQALYVQKGITTKAIKHASETQAPYKGFYWSVVT